MGVVAVVVDDEKDVFVGGDALHVKEAARLLPDLITNADPPGDGCFQGGLQRARIGQCGYAGAAQQGNDTFIGRCFYHGWRRLDGDNLPPGVQETFQQVNRGAQQGLGSRRQDDNFVRSLIDPQRFAVHPAKFGHELLITQVEVVVG